MPHRRTAQQSQVSRDNRHDHHVIRRHQQQGNDLVRQSLRVEVDDRQPWSGLRERRKDGQQGPLLEHDRGGRERSLREVAGTQEPATRCTLGFFFPAPVTGGLPSAPPSLTPAAAPTSHGTAVGVMVQAPRLAAIALEPADHHGQREHDGR